MSSDRPVYNLKLAHRDLAQVSARETLPELKSFRNVSFLDTGLLRGPSGSREQQKHSAVNKWITRQSEQSALLEDSLFIEVIIMVNTPHCVTHQLEQLRAQKNMIVPSQRQLRPDS